MSFVIIHGEDRIKSRQELQKRTAASTDVVTLDGKNITLETVILNNESASLFGDLPRLTVIENLHRLKSKTEQKEIITYLSTLKPEEVSLIIWESQELTKSQIKKFPQAEIIVSKISPIIFALTDSISPQVAVEKRISLCNAACHENAPEMVLVMLARHVRLMISTFDSAAFWPPNMVWQKTKLTKIAQVIGLKTLINLHHQLALIDTQSKTGILAGTLESKLAIWMATIH